MAEVRMKKILTLLKKQYPDAHCALDFKTPYELLIATILSAQCTDARVNQVTPVLFKKFADAHAMSKAKVEQIEEIIRSTGFFRSKAKSILETSKELVREYDGEVPPDLEKLWKLRGVGRKTANVILGNAYGIPGLVVDTHVGRLCRRMGFTKASDPVKVEHEMMKIVSKAQWTIFSHYLIAHGRATCMARNPACERCVIKELCPKKGVPTRKTS